MPPTAQVGAANTRIKRDHYERKVMSVHIDIRNHGDKHDEAVSKVKRGEGGQLVLELIRASQYLKTGQIL
jgi:hypothetical protein